ncbi:MAG: threonine ammonia-lyase IlvA [Pseudomonadota bacterium]
MTASDPAPIPPEEPGDAAAFRAGVEAAAAALRAVLPPTPLQKNAFLSHRYSAEIWLKREDLTPVRSYKLRGAFNFFRKALAAQRAVAPDGRPPLFICASAGNHAQGFAYACSHFKTHGVVFMPVTTPQQKIDKTKAFGGDQVEIRLVGDIFDEAYAAAISLSQRTGALLAPPFDHADIIEGQATVALEILAEQSAPFDLLIAPVGGGGLSAGLCRLFEAHSPTTEILLVEPEGAPSLTRALAAGRPVKLDTVDPFVDGAAVAEVGALPFATLRRRAPESVRLINENRLCETIVEMLNVEGVVLEPAGALEVDALRWLEPSALAGKRVLCITSGGNFDFERLPEVKERALKAAGLKKYFILRLPQRPGALRDFLDLLGPEDDIARFEYLKKSTRNFGSILIGIETRHSQNFAALNARMLDAGFVFQDITDDELMANFIL